MQQSVLNTQPGNLVGGTLFVVSYVSLFIERDCLCWLNESHQE